MPSVQVLADDGRVTLIERIHVEDFDAPHYRDCLAERIGWAAADAELLEDDDDLLARFTRD